MIREGIQDYAVLSYSVTFGSKIAPCNKIDKPLMVYYKIFRKRYHIHNNIAYIMTK